VIVAAEPAHAFAIFTERLGDWWPLAMHGVFDDGSGVETTVAFQGSLVVERSAGRESIWAEVTEWDPPHALQLAWHPGDSAENATVVRVSFSPVDAGTLVSLVHSGWEILTDPNAAAADYASGWPGVLQRYAERATRPA
jgi:uncharacterized protein YndB with AHSA1/START domain